MILTTPAGAEWRIEDAPRRLSLRARLPGAFVFDRAAHSLRNMKARGAPAIERLPLAYASSWMVNSPANSKVMRRWSLSPQLDVWVALVGALEGPLEERGEWAAIEALLGRLGDEPFLIEAASKVLALLVPEVVPLMPAPARAFLLGESAGARPGAFVEICDWFVKATRAEGETLDEWADGHQEVTLERGQVLDRLLWFDSEGHRHFTAEMEATPPERPSPRE